MSLTPGKRRNYIYYLAGPVSLVTFLLYLPALHNDFVGWDDRTYVLDNPYIRSFNLAFFRWAFFDFYASNWHPLTWISHALDYAVWGLYPMGHHLTNNILHAVNTFLVVLLAVRLVTFAQNRASANVAVPLTVSPPILGGVAAGRGSNWNKVLLPDKPPLPLWDHNSPFPPLILRGGGKAGGVNQGGELDGQSTSHDSQFTIHDSHFTLIAAGVTGLLFGIHPLHVESVAWIAERKDLLCALFYLLSIMAYVKYAGATSHGAKGIEHSEKNNMQRAVSSIRYALGPMLSFKGPLLYALCFFALALLSKPMAVSLPVVLLILDWYPFERVRSLKTFLPVFAEKLPFIVFSLISSVLTVLAQKAGESVAPMTVLPFSTRMLVAAKSLIAYLWKMILPLNLIPLYPYPRDISFLSLEFLAPMFLMAVITAACIVTLRKEKLWFSVWFYYVVTLIPVIGIVQVGGQPMADRYTYLPGLGPFLIAGLAAAWIYEKAWISKKVGVFIKAGGIMTASVILVCMSYTTLRQISIWRDGITLWNYVIEREPLKVPRAYINGGFALMEKGLLDEAIEYFQIAIRLEPANANAHTNLGVAYKSKGLYDEAAEQFLAALSLKPDDPETHNNLGVAYRHKGMYERAIEEHRIALSLKPEYAESHFNLGIVYIESGAPDKAREEFEAGLKIKPDDQKARQVLRDIRSR